MDTWQDNISLISSSKWANKHLLVYWPSINPPTAIKRGCKRVWNIMEEILSAWIGPWEKLQFSKQVVCNKSRWNFKVYSPFPCIWACVSLTCRDHVCSMKDEFLRKLTKGYSANQCQNCQQFKMISFPNWQELTINHNHFYNKHVAVAKGVCLP